MDNKLLTINELTQELKVRKGKEVCTSLDVAKYFGKRHDHIIRAIETKILGIASEDFTALNFELSKYKDKSGKWNKMYYITRDGLSLLAIGFTGKKAMTRKTITTKGER